MLPARLAPDLGRGFVFVRNYSEKYHARKSRSAISQRPFCCSHGLHLSDRVRDRYSNAVGRACQSAWLPKSWREQTKSSARSRSDALERFFLGLPVPRLVRGGDGTSHAVQLLHWTHEMSPTCDLCLRTPPRVKKVVPELEFPGGHQAQ